MKKLLFSSLILLCMKVNYAQNTWNQKADFGGTGTYVAAGFSIGGKGYIGTGQDSTGRKNDFWEYDPATNAWTQKPDFGEAARNDATGFSIGSKGYIGIGTSSTGHKNDFCEYDPATNAWTQKADFGGTGRFSATGFNIGSKGYIGTGDDGASKNDFWEYDPVSNAWTQKADFGGTARSSATGFSIGGKGYIGIGISSTCHENDFWEYDTAANAWTQKANFGGGDNSISTNVSGASFCTASSLSISFTAAGTYNTGNISTAQLSNASGSFASPVTIGSISGTASGTIDGSIPSNTAPGTAHRIRVVSNNPAVTGSDNGKDITITTPTTFYHDADGDGFGDPNQSQSACTQPENYVSNNTDCNDDDKTINPNTVWVLDNDKDGYYTGDPVTQCASLGTGDVIKTTQQDGDCNDNEATVHPGAAEICGNNIDDNCDGQTDGGCNTCSNATSLSTTNITAHSARLNWVALSNPAKWQVEYKNVSKASRWTQITLVRNARWIVISSLRANNTYKWRIRAKCGGAWTAFSNAIGFKTLSSQQTNSTIAQQSLQLKNITEDKSPVVKLYPNPTRGQFVIELHLANNINTNAKIELVNIMGQTVSTENATVSNEILQKNVTISSSLASGMYMVKVVANNKTYLARLIYEK